MRFVLLDQLLQLQPGVAARARAVFPEHLELFADHFPGNPVVPGVLLTESMCQTAGWLIAASCGFSSWPLLVRIDRANFRRLVPAGAPLVIEATIKGSRDETYEVMAEVRSAGEGVADARLLFKLFRFDLADTDAERFNDWAKETFTQLDGPAALAAAQG